MSTPYQDGLVAPARTFQHDRTLIAWPVRDYWWSGHLVEAKAEYAAVAAAIAAYEPVTMIVNPGQSGEVAEQCGDGVSVLEAPINDAWVRDNGPIFLVDGAGGVALADFGFNGCGVTFVPHDKDNALPEVLAHAFGMRRYVCDMVLEGGGFTVDGEGTLIATEESVLHPNRNPGMSRGEVELAMRHFLGVEKVVWLPFGLVEDPYTNGHSDNVVQFVRPGTVLAQVAPDRANPNWDRLRSNLEQVKRSTDASGRQLEVIELATLPYTEEIDGERYAVPYVNFYPVNGALIVPQLDAPGEDDAFSLLAEAFPGREIVGVPSRILALGGGGVGCITQQVPAGTPLGAA